MPVRWGWVRSLQPWARPLLRVAQWLLPFGGDRGAMLVKARGQDGEGQPVEVQWRLDTDANRGPYVPVLAAVVLARKWRDGELLAGAYACSGLLRLADFEADLDALGLMRSMSLVAQESSPQGRGEFRVFSKLSP